MQKGMSFKMCLCGCESGGHFGGPNPHTLTVDELPKHEPNLEGIVNGIKNACSEDPKTNPKARAGGMKVPLGLVPPVAIAYCASAMRDGANKYGAWNFREVDISATVYIDACKRHLDLWFDGQEYASDSGVHNLGAAMACISLLLDSQHQGNLVDDRPLTNGKLEELYDSLRST